MVGMSPKLKLMRTCGKISAYNNGCHCAVCKQTKAATARRYRRTKTELGHPRRSQGVATEFAVNFTKRTCPGYSGGVVYAVALMPDMLGCRTKIGWSMNARGRLATFFTTCPTAVLVGVWPAKRNDERQLHRLLPGRIGNSEVFDHEVESLLALIDGYFAPPCTHIIYPLCKCQKFG